MKSVYSFDNHGINPPPPRSHCDQIMFVNRPLRTLAPPDLITMWMVSPSLMPWLSSVSSSFRIFPANIRHSCDTDTPSLRSDNSFFSYVSVCMNRLESPRCDKATAGHVGSGRRYTLLLVAYLSDSTINRQLYWVFTFGRLDIKSQFRFFVLSLKWLLIRHLISWHCCRIDCGSDLYPLNFHVAKEWPGVCFKLLSWSLLTWTPLALDANWWAEVKWTSLIHMCMY